MADSALSLVADLGELSIGDDLSIDGGLSDEPDDLYADEESGEIPFDANLAAYCDDGYLELLAQRVCEWVEVDKEARRDWTEREARGMRFLGVTDKTEGGADFKGASRVVHPMLSLACVQFQARSIAELWPAGGPVKTQVLGASDEEKQAQADRVAGYLNYQYTELMPGAFTEVDRLLMRLPMSGSCFKRVYFDPVDGQVVARTVEPTKIYVPYAATDLRTVQRYTYEFEESTNDTRRKQIAGFYIDIDLAEPSDVGQDRNEAQQAIDQADGSAPIDADEEDSTYTRYEAACFLDLPEFEDEDEYGPTGIAVPYLVTVDKDSQRVLRICRNWRESDPDKRRRVHLIHYYFVPGFGFYGFGFVHLAGGLSQSATGAIRALLDAAFLANTKSGFLSRDLRMGSGRLKINMAEWNEINASSEELARGFHEFKYSEPSKALVDLLGILGEMGKEISASTDQLTGDANNNAPVGTTLALIEQGLKLFSAIHKRLHESQREEFRLVAELNAEHLPVRYPYDVAGESREVMAADFDGRVDVTPVSDPNIVTNTQRIAQAQSVLRLASENADLYERRQAHRNMLEVMRVPNIEEILPDPGDVPRREPVAEGMALMVGGAVAVFPDQDHAAHIAVHGQWIAGVPEALREQVTPGFMAHVAEHYAQLYRARMVQAIGVDLPPEGAELPPQIEAQLAQAAAQVGTLSMPLLALPQETSTGAEDVRVGAEIARKDALADADIERKDRESGARIEREAADEIARSMVETVKTRRALQAIESGQEPNLRGIEDYGR